MSPLGSIFIVLIAILPLLAQGQSQASKSSTVFYLNPSFDDRRFDEKSIQINGIDLNTRPDRKLLNRKLAATEDRDLIDSQRVQDVRIPLKPRGGVGDGGGDPRASKILEYGRKAVAWLLGTSQIGLGVNEYELLSRIEVISLSLDGKEPLLRFQSVEDISCFGSLKKGCTNSDGSIDIAGLYWENPSTSTLAQCSLALTELLRPQQSSHIYDRAPQICELIGIKNDISSAPVSNKTNPIPRITSLAIASMNSNYDGSEDGLDLTTRPIVLNTVLPPIVPTIRQRLFDSPLNGPQHEWTDHISGMSIYRVYYSKKRQSELVNRSVFFDGFIKMTKIQPRTIRFQGKISGTLGTAEQIQLENGHYEQIKHGIWPTTCDVSGEFDFVESSEEPGFYQLWEPLPYCTEDPKNPFLGVTHFIYEGGQRVHGAGLHGKIGFWTK